MPSWRWPGLWPRSRDARSGTWSTSRKRAAATCACISTSRTDCEDFSRALDPILDEADPIPDSYIFEVSSAGAERQLKRPGDFERFLGAQVEVRLYQPVDGSKVHIGTLEQYDNGDVTVSDGKTRRVFQKSAIAQVRLHLTI